ncbi:GNAT family N-acetyltransferase [Arthrobacter sp. NPDC092385]|uniref:GNAT family N-acetyltransferase n=1 Tax=Arthrobacter sp. NPDC092385 TaxID=3363943 RepID=UPI003828E94D
MDAELGPRYRAFVEQGHPRPLPPRAEDIATVWVAVIDDRPAATAALLRTPDYWEVKRVYVSPEFRRRPSLGRHWLTSRRLLAPSACRTWSSRPGSCSLKP